MKVILIRRKFYKKKVSKYMSDINENISSPIDRHWNDRLKFAHSMMEKITFYDDREVINSDAIYLADKDKNARLGVHFTSTPCKNKKKEKRKRKKIVRT